MTTGESYDKYLERQGALSDTEPNELAHEIEKNWRQYDWERGDLLDRDPEERAEYYVMTCEVNGIIFEGTGNYTCGELELIENVEIKR